jgi:FtsZ-binding cell division protein ZapB
MQTNVSDNFSINDRILQLIKYLGITNNQFAVNIGISSGRMSNIATKRNKPDSEMLSMISQKYPNVSGNWLLTGAGYMILQKFPDSKNLSAQSEGAIECATEGAIEGAVNKVMDIEENLGAYKIISTQIVNLLLKETKELNQEIGALKHENEQLKTENAQLQGKIEDLKDHIEKAV